MSAIPDFIKLKDVPVDYDMNVESDLLEPVVFQEGTETGTGFCRFELQNKGFLHSQSKLFLSLVPNADVGQGFYPLSVGVGSLIDRAVLKVGNQVINEISDWQYLHLIKSMQISNETQKEREQYTTGRMINHKWLYEDVNNDDSKVLADRYGLDNGREYSSGQTVLKPLPFQILNGSGTGAVPISAADALKKSPTYQVDLSDLFPFLSTNSLPLYMINQPVSIELHWAKTATARVSIGTTESVNGKPFLIDRNELKFCADYVFYAPSTDMMQRYAESNPSLEFTFVDYRLTKSTVDQAALTAGVVRNLGMANRLVSRVLTTITRTGAGDDEVLNAYCADAQTQTADGVLEPFEYNIRYNDRYEFSQDIDNHARLMSLFTQTESMPFVSKKEYTNEGTGITSKTFFGRQQNLGGLAGVGLSGRFNVYATRLTAGRIGQQGIELHLKVQGMAATTHNIRSYCEYLRVARLVDGDFQIFNV